MPTPPTSSTRRAAGDGSQRERRPGVWEIRVSLGPDPVTRRSRHRSITVHGDAEHATTVRRRLTSQGVPPRPPAPALLRDLLKAWRAADQPWRPSTLVGYRSVVRALTADPLGRFPATSLTADLIRQSVARWHREGASVAVVGGRFRILRSASGWAYTERLIDVEPLRHMRGPGRCAPRRPLADDDVRRLLATAELRLLEAIANDGDRPAHRLNRHRAELDLLLVRLAPDTAARRGELAALRITDLRGRTLSIDRAVSAGQLTAPKSGRGRTLTVGASTAALWNQLIPDWTTRCLAVGPDDCEPVLGRGCSAPI